MAEESRPEDPRALAERLAREAKARLAAQKVAEARARAAQAAPPPAAPAEAPKKTSLADRAGQIRKPMSAKEALAAAIAAENQAATDPAAQPRVAASPRPPSRTVTPDGPVSRPATARPAPASAPARPAPASATSAPAAADVARAASLVATLLPGAKLEGAPIPVVQADVFRALWQAHRVRALHEKDWALVSTASVLVDAVDRVTPGHLFAVRVQLDGQPRAVWLDLERKALLGIVGTPEIYLAGL